MLKNLLMNAIFFMHISRVSWLSYMSALSITYCQYPDFQSVHSKAEWRYMTVWQNWSNQLIKSNWRIANPERPTVGFELPAECCPPWAGWGLWHKMSWFSLHMGVRLLGRSVLIFSFNLYWTYWNHITKFFGETAATDHILLTLGKQYLCCNLSVTTESISNYGQIFLYIWYHRFL